MIFEVLTLFPEVIESFVQSGLLGKAVEQGQISVHCTNFRDFTQDRHRTVDDIPYGGGPGMVLKPEPVAAALEHVQAARGRPYTVLLTPSGRPFQQRDAERLASLEHLALLCGRYEGIDDRIRENRVDECISLGDFVLNGGEVAALAVIEAVARLRDGVLGNPESAQRESFADSQAGSLLEHPQYTRPPEFDGSAVPAVLLGGDHAKIQRWRRRKSLARTWMLRPELRLDRKIRPLGSGWMLIDPMLDASARDALVGLALRVGMEVRWVGPSPGDLGPSQRGHWFRDLRAFRRSCKRKHGEVWIQRFAAEDANAQHDASLPDFERHWSKREANARVGQWAASLDLMSLEAEPGLAGEMEIAWGLWWPSGASIPRREDVPSKCENLVLRVCAANSAIDLANPVRMTDPSQPSVEWASLFEAADIALSAHASILDQGLAGVVAGTQR